MENFQRAVCFFLPGGDGQIGEAVAIGVAPGAAAGLRMQIFEANGVLLQHVDAGAESRIGIAEALHGEINVRHRAFRPVVTCRFAAFYLQITDFSDGVGSGQGIALQGESREGIARHGQIERRYSVIVRCRHCFW